MAESHRRSSSSSSSSSNKIKAVFFDFMGTCLDWHTGVVRAFPASLSESQRSDLALEWRHTYFDVNSARAAADLPPEDIDVTLRSVLDDLVDHRHPELGTLFDEKTRTKSVAAFHSMSAWPDVAPAIQGLKMAGYEVFVFGNGTVRLQLDLCRSSGLEFDMLFSSQLLGLIKPDPRSYLKVLDLIKIKAEEAVMVAAHAYDTRGAMRVGMKGVYIRRWTDDVNEDFERVEKEHDAFLPDMVGLVDVVGQL